MVVKTASSVSSPKKTPKGKKTGKGKIEVTTNLSESLRPQEEKALIGNESLVCTESLISEVERMSMISEAAYYRAEQRGFPDGGHEQDWLDAERSVDKMLCEAAEKANY
ncbi:MAG: DUF2934 domain-containing protein [Gammaproteobacteria bacterium]|nr:DUF2934 domain-containing protein [Gammaproteobacteria bacterium]